MAKLILQHEKACYICGTTLNLHLHHIYGGANRSISDKDGCVVYLCVNHHTGAQGVHLNHKIDLALKVRCQKEWQKQNKKSKDDFIKRYGKSYL